MLICRYRPKNKQRFVTRSTEETKVNFLHDSRHDTSSFFYFSIRPPPALLPVLGLLTQYMTPTLDPALLYVVHRDGVTTINHDRITHVCGYRSI